VTTRPPNLVGDAAEQPGSDTIHPPPGVAELPLYDAGWVADAGDTRPFLSYVSVDSSVNWSAELEALHEESSRTHFLDRWTRAAILRGIAPTAQRATIADIGCSTGHLLEDLRVRWPQAELIGVDLVASGLRNAHGSVPSARLLRADACELPIANGAVDAVVSANLLEHIPDDRRALSEMARVLRPGGRAAIVVPAGPGTYDYYDRFLGHERRYAHGELAAKCAEAGLRPVADLHLASLIYPAFWLVKQRNRRRYDDLAGAVLEAQVAGDIRRTQDSRVGNVLWRLEDALVGRGVRLPFGIRSLVVAEREPGGR
jgi:ubiquinone/menaquinone biosynthesis C-methylase UbiE